MSDLFFDVVTCRTAKRSLAGCQGPGLSEGSCFCDSLDVYHTHSKVFKSKYCPSRASTPVPRNEKPSMCCTAAGAAVGLGCSMILCPYASSKHADHLPSFFVHLLHLSSPPFDLFLHATVVRGPKHHLKRLNAPSSWMLDKLSGTYAPRPTNGPHKLREALPLIVSTSTSAPDIFASAFAQPLQPQSPASLF